MRKMLPEAKSCELIFLYQQKAPNQPAQIRTRHRTLLKISTGNELGQSAKMRTRHYTLRQMSTFVSAHVIFSILPSKLSKQHWGCTPRPHARTQLVHWQQQADELYYNRRQISTEHSKGHAQLTIVSTAAKSAKQCKEQNTTFLRPSKTQIFDAAHSGA